MKPNVTIMVMMTAVLFSSFVVQAQNKVVVVPLGGGGAAAAQIPQIAHITWSGPNTGSSCLNCFGVKTKGAGKVLAVQAWSTSGVGSDWWGDVKKNGTSVLSTRPKFTNQTVTTGVVKTDGTEIFAEGDTLTFSTVEDSENPNPTYPGMTAIIQYD